MSFSVWNEVKNTVYDRVLDDSLMHTLSTSKKIKKQTKFINQKLKKKRNNLRSYNQYLKLRKRVCKTFRNDDETDDEPGLNYEEIKKIHQLKSKSYLKTFLKLCTLKKTVNRYRRPTKIKAPTLDSVRSKKSPIVKQYKRIIFPKSNKTKYHPELPGETSGSVPEKLRSQSSEFKSPNSEETIISLDKANCNRSDICKDDNAKEKKCIEKIVKSLMSINSREESIDYSVQSDFDKVESVDIENNVAEENYSKESSAEEPQYDVINKSKSSDLQVESKVLNNQKQDSRNVNGDGRDNLNASNSVIISKEISNEGNPLSLEDIFMTNDEKIDLEENIGCSNAVDKYNDALNHDSGNNSLSDADFFKEEYRQNCIDNPVEYDKGIVSAKYLNINEGNTILSDKSSEFEKNFIKLNGFLDPLGLDNRLNIPQIELRKKNLTEDERLSESNLDSDASQEIPLAKPIHGSQLGDELLIGSTSDNCRSKLKIKTIEHYNGCEIFSKYQFSKRNKLEIVNNSDNKTIENELPLKDEELLRSRKFSEDSNLSRIESQNLNGLVDREDSLSALDSSRENLDRSTNNKSIQEEKSGSDKSCEEHDLSEIPSHCLNRSLNSSFSSFSARSFDEDYKNSVHSQLLSEIEERLRDSPSPRKKKSSRTQSQKLNGDLYNENAKSSKENIDTSTDGQIPMKDAQLLNSTESDLKKVQSKSLNRCVDAEDSLLSPKSTPIKRRFSNSSSDYCSVNNTPRLRKQLRLDKQRTKKQLELISCERKSPQAIPRELQPTVNKDESPNKKNQESNAPKTIRSTATKRPRPQNLEEFVITEGLTQDKTKPYFRLKDIGDDDEIWIMDVPKTIDPKDLEDRMILLGGKSELIFGDDRYKVSSRLNSGVCNVSCVVTTSRSKKQYEIVNVESKGCIKFRKKFSVIPESRLTPGKTSTVPFPKNLKIRHPLFGASYKDKISQTSDSR